MATITLPHNFTPRPYQIDFLRAIDEGYKRLILVWPRRHGKDKTCLNALGRMMVERVANYYYVFPQFNQGRKALWDNIDSQGFKTMDHLPQSLRRRTDNTQMLIELHNNSTFQIIGAADIDTIVGTNPAVLIFSEYSLMNPSVWAFMLPILAENGGTAIFNYTPRGDNHARTLFEKAQDNDEWYVSYLTALDAGIFSAYELAKIRQEYIELYGDDRLYQQEFMCSFDEPVPGSYYGELLRKAEDDGRLTRVPYETDLKVHTAWDLGVGDATAIWFWQQLGREVRLIDYYESQGKGLDHYVAILQSKGYLYGEHYAPHDIRVREMGTGVSRLETAKKLGIVFRITPRLSLDDGIQAARTLLARAWFDTTKCEQGINALKNYHKDYDEEKRVYSDKPEHDWSSHAADAFRYLAVNVMKPERRNDEMPEDDIPLYARSGATGINTRVRDVGTARY